MIKDYLDEQKKICQKYGSEMYLVDESQKVGIALHTLNQSPIYGVHLRPEGDTSGWYFWGGEHSESADFYQAVHINHLPEIASILLKYLALAPGFKFIIDDQGYEDVWFEPEIIATH